MPASLCQSIQPYAGDVLDGQLDSRTPGLAGTSFRSPLRFPVTLTVFSQAARSALPSTVLVMRTARVQRRGTKMRVNPSFCCFVFARRLMSPWVFFCKPGGWAALVAVFGWSWANTDSCQGELWAGLCISWGRSLMRLDWMMLWLQYLRPYPADVELDAKETVKATKVRTLLGCVFRTHLPECFCCEHMTHFGNCLIKLF